jgi:predicted nucleic acid-binding protein
MKHVFIDTNILMDMLFHRMPYKNHTLELFALQEKRLITTYTSTNTILSIAYYLKKAYSPKIVKEVLFKLMDSIQIIEVNKSMLVAGLISLTDDYEDAVQIHCALSNRKITHIITRNKKDFKDCPLHICTAEKFNDQFNS